MRASIRESEIEDRLRLELTRRGHLCLKFVSPGYAGVPDRICLLSGGRLVFVELKAPGQKPKPHQQRRIELLRKLGFEVEVIDTMAGVEDFIKRAEEIAA